MKRATGWLLASTLVLLTAAPALAQSVRVSGSTVVRYIELRPLLADSVAVGETEGGGLLRQTSDGRVVRCIPEEPFCRDTRPGERVSTVPVIQDLELSAWGFGEGAQLFAQLRGRTAWGGTALWPQADDALEVLAAYAQLERAWLRVRVGRQWKVSGLGFYNFDGVAAALRPSTSASLELYAGRSLIRGLNEPRTGGALQAIEELAPVQPGLLLGVQARYRPTPRLALSGFYQVDFRDDREGIYSELAALDGVARLGGGALEGSLELDLAGAALNEARLRARSPMLGRVVLHTEARRYRPYFELWTIWGAFSPVGFDEVRGGATWLGRGRGLLLRAEASYRNYGDAGGDDVFGSFRGEGWGIAANAGWSPASDWRLEAGARADAGFGAARREGQLSARRQLGEAGSIAAHALAFQRLYEFRLDEGTVFGFGTEASLALSDRVRLFASATAYRHRADAGTSIDWTQRRGSVRLQWTLGPEPGLGVPVGGVR